MIPSIIQLKQDVRELRNHVEMLTRRCDMLHAHIENLIERVHELECAGNEC